MAKRRPSGDGMVRKREDGRWEGRIVVGHKSNGDSIFRYLSAGSQKELLAKLHRNIGEYRDVDLREESKMPLGEWLDRWLEEYAAPSVRPSTLEGYRGYVERNIKPRLGNKPVGKITVEDIRQLYWELQEHGRQEEHPQYGYKLAGSTIRRIHGVLHEALDAAAQENLIARNPTDGIILPRKKAAPKQVLNNAQLERFMTAIQEDKVWHDFFYTELTTGLRRGEICGLMWQDFDEAHGTLTVRRTIHAERGGRLTAGETKTGAGKRIITLPPSTAQLLSERRKRSYRKILVCRPNAQFDADIGFLPGSEQEKISPLMRPIVDNLEILLDLEGKKKERRNEEELRGRIDYLFDTGIITAEAMNFMRGRSITDTWLVIDEAQNLTPRQVKGIITRVGKGTKVVLLGDPAQIDHPLLDTRSNGLTYASARMKGSPLCVQLTMLPDECERSSLALDAAMRM